jgi:Cu/Ag efflux protein CusF
MTMSAPLLRSAAALAGIMVVALSIPATESHATDLGKDDEVSVRGDIVAADPTTRMIIVESPERDTLSYRVLPTMGASSSGDTFKRLRPGVTVDLRYYRVVDMLVAKSTPEIDKQAAGTVIRTDLAAKKIDIVDSNGGMVYRTPWIKSAEGQAVLATLKPGDKVTMVFSERTAFEVVPIN